VEVVAHENAAGDIAIGVEVEGAFVPIASVSKAKVGQLVERYETLKERAAAGDEVAKDVLGGAYKAPKPVKGGS